MVNLVFLVGLDIDPCSCDEYGEWISEELGMVLSAEGTGTESVVVTYCGELNEGVISDG